MLPYVNWQRLLPLSWSRCAQQHPSIHSQVQFTKQHLAIENEHGYTCVHRDILSIACLKLVQMQNVSAEAYSVSA